MPVSIRRAPGSSALPVFVAAYIRMSTDMQQYSLANQKAAIDTYAVEHGMSVVREYRDEGRSGLTIEHRPGLTALMEDIRSGCAAFDAVLVLDVTRWGRFQNTDEGAFYEFLCWRAGVQVLYVGESFENDQSPFSLVFKGIKRAMAGDGRSSTYRMILCAPRYCALFDGKKAVTVSASSVIRTDSPAPGRQH